MVNDYISADENGLIITTSLCGHSNRDRLYKGPTSNCIRVR